MNVYITYSDSEFGTGRRVLKGGQWILHASTFQPDFLDFAISLIDERVKDHIIQRTDAALAQTITDSETDIEAADTVYVYVGVTAMQKAMDLITKLLARGKKVVMTGCDCEQARKQRFASENKIEFVMTSVCGGYGILSNLIGKP